MMLYLVATPIGNLEDMTFRGVRVLQEVDLIAAEDTRHTGKLLHHFQITTPQISYHQHNARQRIQELVARLQQGESIALVSDAGMPGISDPGYELVKACIEGGIQVIPIPGATAGILALVAAGLPTAQFAFEGFLPVKQKERRARLERLQYENRTFLIYEAPHRLKRTLEDLEAILGADRQVVTGRELTKVHEEFWRGTLGEAVQHYQEVQPRGEFVLVVAGVLEQDVVLSPGEIKAQLQEMLAQGISRSRASKELAQLTSLSRREIYQLTLEED
jgi:16S rRNA (cytidine1402-2'-O)-methyltransferase